MTIKIYCKSCGKGQEFVVEPMKEHVFNNATIAAEFRKEHNLEANVWGNILCKECNFILVALTAGEEGIYDFVKVSELP